jgi:CRISPR-associated protein Cas6
MNRPAQDLTMYWQETESSQPTTRISDDIVDIAFRVQCTTLPVDHAFALCSEIHRLLPWFPGQQCAGIHLIHGAETGNGWNRPDDSGQLILSRRTRLTLRIPAERRDDAMALCGAALCVEDCRLDVGEASVKPLLPSTTLFSRHVPTAPHWAESDFLRHVAEQLGALDISVRKMLCGKLHNLQMKDSVVHTRSVMIADLELDESVRLQQFGIGNRQAFGLGLFLPHKGINAVYQKADET